jgi:hypothetical protein
VLNISLTCFYALISKHSENGIRLVCDDIMVCYLANRCMLKKCCYSHYACCHARLETGCFAVVALVVQMLWCLNTQTHINRRSYY